MDRSPYLAAALEAMQKQPQTSPGGTAMNMGAQLLGQYGLERNQRQQQATQQAVPMSAPSYTDASQMGQPTDPYSMQGVAQGSPMMGQPRQPMGGGLYGLGQKLMGMFGGH